MSPEARPSGRLFRKYVVVLLVLVGGVLLVSSVVELYFSYQETKNALVRLEREKAIAAADRIERFVKDIEQQLRWTTEAAFPDPTAAREQREIDFLRLLRNVPAVTELAYVDAAGKEQLRVSRFALDEIASGKDRAGTPTVTAARSGKTYFSPVYFRNESEPYMTVAVPGGENGLEVTLAEVNLKSIWDVVSQIRIGESGWSYVVDSTGHLVAHPDISLVLQKRDLSQLPQVAAARAARGPDLPAGMVAAGLEGGQVLTAHAVIGPLGWVVFVEQPLREALAPLTASIVRSGVLFALGLLLSVLASVLLARRMVAPIKTLQEGAARIGAGERGHRIDIRTGDELQALADEVNSAAARLEESYADLEQRVEARTRELAGLVERLRALSETSHVIGSTLDLHTVLTSIVTHAVRLTEADAGTIYEFDEETEQFSLRATDRMDAELVEALRAVPIRLGEGAVGRAGARREPIQIHDMLVEGAYDSHAREVLVESGFRSLLAVPLLSEDRIVGGLVVRRRAPGAFSADLVELLGTFAVQSALAIQNARLFREIREQGRELEIASAHKSQFLANMSHELRTPLNAILGYTELIIDDTYGPVPDKIREVLERLDRSGRHLLGLINDVLDLSKIEAGQVALNLTDYALRDVVQTVVQAVEALATEKRIALRVSVAPELPAARGDVRRITQVLLNLVGNAIKFTDVGEVVIDVKRNGTGFLVAVTDTGPGIDTADQQKIFEEFQQAEHSIGTKRGGTGLGLAIARRIVGMHGGRLWVESAPGHGSTFRFTLPLSVEA